MVDFLRSLRGALYELSAMQVYGIDIDFILHLLVAFAAVLILQKFFSLRKSVYWVAALIVAKEVLDLFAKSRIDYIRSPTLDVVVDVVFGCMGVAAAVWFIKRRGSTLAPRPVGRAQAQSTVDMGVEVGVRRGLIPVIFGVSLAALCLFLLAQGIYASSNRAVFSSVALITALVFLASKRRYDSLLFLLLPLGPIINMSGYFRDPYLYTFEVVLLVCFFLWFLVSRHRLEYTSTLLKLYLLFFATLVPSILEQFLAGNSLTEIRLLRGYFLGLCLVVLLTNLGPNLHRYAKLFVQSLLVTSLFVVLWGAIEYLSSVQLGGSLRHESHSVFTGSEMLAIYLALVIPIAWLTSNVFTGRLSRAISPMVGLGGFALLLTTGSRIALIAVLVAAALYLVTTARMLQASPAENAWG